MAETCFEQTRAATAAKSWREAVTNATANKLTMKTATLKPAKAQREEDRAKDQAKVQLECIREMVKAMRDADDSDDSDARDKARESILEDALSVEVRGAWFSPGNRHEGSSPVEFRILLCTGGPACRIVGELDERDEPDLARIEYQDWFTPWTEYRLDEAEEKDVLEYCRTFYFGE